MLQGLLSVIRPSALTGLTTGLRFIAEIHPNGRPTRVYSNLKVIEQTDTAITFEGGAFASKTGSIGGGSVHGKIVNTFRDQRGGKHFMSMSF